MFRLKIASKSFRFKLVCSAVLFLVPAIILPTLLIAHLHTGELMRRDEAQSELLFETAEDNLRFLFSDAIDAVNFIQTNQAVEDYVLGHFSDAAQKAIAKREFDEALEIVLRMYSYITDILFIREDGTIVGYSLRWHYSDENGSAYPFMQDENFQVYENSVLPVWFAMKSDNLLSRDIHMLNLPSEYRICEMNRLIYSYSGSAVSHNIIVLIAISEQDVRNRFSYLSNGAGDLLIVDSNGMVLSASDPSCLGQQMSFFPLVGNEKFGSFTYTDNSEEQYHIIYARMDNPHWTLIRRIPNSVYNATAIQLWRNTLIIGLISLIGICILYAIWVRRLCRPLDRMTRALIAVRDGDLEMRLPDDPSAPMEIQLMAEQMNEMLASINDLLMRNEIAEQRKYLMEMRSLQAQITPHFLFNTITSIRWMATMQGAEDIANILTSFVHLLRPVFSDWTMVWSLREEINFAKKYIDLIRMRYGRVEMEIVCDDRLLTGTIPRFTLQPILENCCEHGMRTDQSLLIKVEVLEEEMGIRILVRDNGIGMSSERLRELRQALQSEDDDLEAAAGNHRSIGLRNIQTRLTLYYGEGYGLHVDSVPGVGTQVNILIGKRQYG